MKVHLWILHILIWGSTSRLAKAAAAGIGSLLTQIIQAWRGLAHRLRRRGFHQDVNGRRGIGGLVCARRLPQAGSRRGRRRRRWALDRAHGTAQGTAAEWHIPSMAQGSVGSTAGGRGGHGKMPVFEDRKPGRSLAFLAQKEGSFQVILGIFSSTRQGPICGSRWGHGGGGVHHLGLRCFC